MMRIAMILMLLNNFFYLNAQIDEPPNIAVKKVPSITKILKPIWEYDNLIRSNVRNEPTYMNGFILPLWQPNVYLNGDTGKKDTIVNHNFTDSLILYNYNIPDKSGKSVDIYNLNTGLIKRKIKRIPNSYPGLTKQIIFNDTVVFKNGEKLIQCYSASSDSIIWEYNSEKNIFTEPVYFRNKIIAIQSDNILFLNQKGEPLDSIEVSSK